VNLAPDVLVADVTLREHGQNVHADELGRFTANLRAETARALIAAGIRRLEILSCVAPRIAPAMAEELLARVARGVGRTPDGVRIITLVPNLRGYETFQRLGLGAAGLGHTIGFFFSAVELHNQKNLGRSIAETLAEYEQLARRAHADGTPLVGYASGGFGWRPQPDADLIPVEPQALHLYVERLLGLGCETVTVSDLQGVAAADRTRETLADLLAGLPAEARARIGYHPHHVDPSAGVSLAEAAFDAGVRLFDGSLGATGGCITGAPGNAPTEGILAMLERRGASPNVDRAAIEAIGQRFHRLVAGNAPE
jgi:hydroxymethylglutaryl-CoA lyase